jgi:O-antigen chain-terminating methyltransferase
MNRLASQFHASEDLAAKHVDFGRRLEEQRQEMILQKRRLDLILSELRKKVGEKRESLSKVVAQKERLMDHSYFLFEDRHRGSLEEIRKRQEIYLPIFKERSVSSSATSMTLPRAILDIGCGRGEFLELLREHGVPAKGIDLNEDMVHFCKERGLEVEQTNAIAFLEAQPDDSLGGVISCQVVEHLPTTEMIELLKLCYQKLEKGGRAVFETVNPLSLLVSATNFYLDLSHIRQVHPMALQFLAEAIGFINTEIKFLAPFPDELKLQLLSNNDPDVQKLNQNFTRLNDILFGFQDYAVICEK